MKKYIISLPLVFATFFFVWKKQALEVTPESFQEETSQPVDDQVVEPVSPSMAKVENTESEVAQLGSNEEPVAKIDNDIRIAPSQAPPWAIVSQGYWKFWKM